MIVHVITKSGGMFTLDLPDGTDGPNTPAESIAATREMIHSGETLVGTWDATRHMGRRNLLRVMETQTVARIEPDDIGTIYTIGRLID
jgi:hypothetical protein